MPTLRIACVQLSPTLFECEANIKKTDGLLSRFRKGDVDLIVLPEMAFTGYVFQTKQEIAPFVEDAHNGLSVRWAKQKAVSLSSYVVVGFPEVVQSDNGPVYYNSLCMVNPEGNVVTIYRKTFLYDTDKSWANEGDGFLSLEVDSLGKVGFGICMDLNPKDFVADWYEYEFGTFHQKQKSRIVIVPLNWLANNAKVEENEDEEDDPSEIPPKSLSLINYWLNRLSPLLDSGSVFVACNRVGTERNVKFAGTSCVVHLSRPPELQASLADSEDVLFTTVSYQ